VLARTAVLARVLVVHALATRAGQVLVARLHPTLALARAAVLAVAVAAHVFAMTAGPVLVARPLPTLVPASAVVAMEAAATASAHAQMATAAVSAKLRLMPAPTFNVEARAHAAVAAASVQEATQAAAARHVSEMNIPCYSMLLEFLLHAMYCIKCCDVCALAVLAAATAHSFAHPLLCMCGAFTQCSHSFTSLSHIVCHCSPHTNFIACSSRSLRFNQLWWTWKLQQRRLHMLGWLQRRYVRRATAR
jgi:hypothetical protein